jgi:orotate phosphoribosyltransferase
MDRQQGGEAFLAKQNVHLRSLTTMNHVLKAAQRMHVDEEKIEELWEYVEDPKRWHKERGYVFEAEVGGD